MGKSVYSAAGRGTIEKAEKEKTMNTSQDSARIWRHVIMWLAIATCVIMVLYPPWMSYLPVNDAWGRRIESQWEAGKHRAFTDAAGRIDSARLLFQISPFAGIAVGLFLWNLRFGQG